MKRRDFTKVVGAVVAGLAAGSRLEAADDKEGDSGAKHACKGMNECKGQGGCKTGDNECAGKNSCKGKGGCATAAHHECKGQNECKGQGGCSSGDNGCAGKNSCKGKGGCEVPVKQGGGEGGGEEDDLGLRATSAGRGPVEGRGPTALFGQ